MLEPSAPQVLPAPACTCTIAFDGHNLRGSLVLLPTPAFLAATDPLARGQLSAHDEGEWTKEIANRLMGGVKSVLSRSGVKLSTALPTLAAPVAPGGDSISMFSLSYGGTAALVQWRVTLADGFALNDDEEPAQWELGDGLLL